MKKYKSDRIIDRKRRRVIVDENGNIINRNPSKEELIGLENEPYAKNKRQFYTRDQLLEYIKRFYKKEGRVPIASDFINNPEYPGSSTYQKYFGNWNKALELSGLLDKRKIRTESLYTNEELLEFLEQFDEENGRPPTTKDFVGNPIYPGFMTYYRQFGNFQKALKLVGLDTDSMIRKGVVETNNQRARWAELIMLEYLENAIDLSGENYHSPYDGICPKGQTYDVKCATLIGDCWTYNIGNDYRKEIEWFFLLAVDKDFKKPKLLHIWRIPRKFADKNTLAIGLNSNHIYNIEKMKEFEITEKVK